MNLELNLNKVLEEIRKLLIDGEGLYESHCNNGRLFGERGWTIPLNSNPGAIAALLRIQDNEEFDKTVTEYIEEDLDKNSTMIINSNIPVYFKNIFIEADKAMKSNLLFPALTAMTALCEGIISLITGNDKTSWSVQADNAKNEIKKLSGDGSVELLIYYSVESFIKDYFAEFSDFKKQEPANLNRHWLMHGRSKREISLHDYYKLFNLLTVLVWSFDNNQNEFLKKEPDEVKV